MQFSKILASLLTFSLAAAAPPFYNKDNKDIQMNKRGVVYVTNVNTLQVFATQTVNPSTSTAVSYLALTSTTTVTRYTATVTLTIDGVPHEYTTVATTSISPSDVEPIRENEVTTYTPSTTYSLSSVDVPEAVTSSSSQADVTTSSSAITSSESTTTEITSSEPTTAETVSSASAIVSSSSPDTTTDNGSSTVYTTTSGGYGATVTVKNVVTRMIIYIGNGLYITSIVQPSTTSTSSTPTTTAETTTTPKVSSSSTSSSTSSSSTQSPTTKPSSKSLTPSKTTQVVPSKTTQVVPSKTLSSTLVSLTTFSSLVTDAPSVSAASSDGWILDNIYTTTEDGVCVVNYDYYLEGEEEETTTIKTTVYTTVTLSS